MLAIVFQEAEERKFKKVFVRLSLSLCTAVSAYRLRIRHRSRPVAQQIYVKKNKKTKLARQLGSRL
jgi:hypothetical protein